MNLLDYFIISRLWPVLATEDRELLKRKKNVRFIAVLSLVRLCMYVASVLV